MTIDELWMSLRSTLLDNKLDRIHYSTLGVQCSMFDVHFLDSSLCKASSLLAHILIWL